MMSHFRTLCQLKVSTLKKGIHIKVFERLLFKDGPVSPLFFLTFFRIYSGSGRHVAVWCKIGVEFFLAAKVSLFFFVWPVLSLHYDAFAWHTSVTRKMFCKKFEKIWIDKICRKKLETIATFKVCVYCTLPTTSLSKTLPWCRCRLEIQVSKTQSGSNCLWLWSEREKQRDHHQILPSLHCRCSSWGEQKAAAGEGKKEAKALNTTESKAHSKLWNVVHTTLLSYITD